MTGPYRPRHSGGQPAVEDLAPPPGQNRTTTSPRTTSTRLRHSTSGEPLRHTPFKAAVHPSAGRPVPPIGLVNSPSPAAGNFVSRRFDGGIRACEGTYAMIA